MGLKKVFSSALLLLLFTSLFLAWLVFGSNTKFEEDKKNFYIATGSSYQSVVENLDKEGIIKNKKIFLWLASYVEYNDKTVKAGKYLIDKNSSVVTVLRMLKNGRQAPVKFVINKIRTAENFAQKLSAAFECDSASVISFLNSNDSLAPLGLNSNTAMTMVIPNTYSFLWNSSANKILKKLFAEQQKFWTPERRAKADGLNLTPEQVYILASIVEEETNLEEDKGKVASVYLNRLETGMKLGADPTVKFAMKDFGLKRIYQKHLAFPSAYNTYQHAGLPPGPICTPSQKTIDAVLNAPTTSYLYFVAKPDLRGGSNFAATYEEHLRFAKAYQQALDSLAKKKSLQ